MKGADHANARPYDVLVIGGGQAGIPLARSLAAKGMRVALAERRHLGGSCVNFGCTPTKAAIASARIAHQSRRAAEWGVRVGEVTVDFPAVIARARAIAERSRHGLEAGFAQAPNPVLLRGHARLDGRTEGGFRVRVGAGDAIARTVVLNTGTRTAMPPIEGLTEINVVHAGNWLDRTALPASLAIIGSGPIGLEMAQFYRRMGSAVTVIDHAARIAHGEDDDVAGAMQALLEAEGIRFRLGETLRRAEGRGDRVALHTGQGAPSRRRRCSSRPGGGRTPMISGWRRWGWCPTRTAWCRAMRGWRRRLRASGSQATSAAGRCSPTRHGTIIASCSRSSRATGRAPRGASCLMRSSPIPNSAASG